MPADALPNLVIAGVTKTGTTSLHFYLSQHPDVFAPQVKEVNHFAPLVHGQPPAELSTYHEHYREAGTQRWRMDASPFYFTGGAAVAEAIATTLPAPRILIVLRDPTKRLWSSYTYKKSKGKLGRDDTFPAFVDECLAHVEQGTDLLAENVNHLTLRSGRYVEFLPSWLDRFGADVRVLFSEDLKAAPERVMRELFAWLDIDPDVSAALNYDRRNPTQTPRSVALLRVGHRVNRRLKPFLASRPRLAKALQSGFRRVNNADADEVLHDEDRRRVDAFYAPSVQELALLLRERGYQDLPPWLGAAEVQV